MAKIISINNNDIFGDFVVKEQDNTKQTAAKYYICQCRRCGQIKSIRSSELRKNPQCICRHGENFIGTNIHGFTVIEKTTLRASDKAIIYKCKCNKCGHIQLIAGNRLRRDNVLCENCGHRQSTLVDMTGQTYEFLKVLKRDMSSQYMGHEQDAYWICKCLKCGSIKTIRGIDIRNGSVKSCGCIKSHGEEIIAKILLNANINFSRQYKFADLYSNQNKKVYYYFDFAIFNKNNQLSHLVEYDGITHFEPSSGGWNTMDSVQKTQQRDKIKNDYCQKHNIKLIRIKYDEEITLEKILGGPYE